MPIDFLARKAYFLDHLMPVWFAMPEELRGNFYMTEEVRQYAQRDFVRTSLLSMVPYADEGDCGHNPILTAQYGDATRAAEFDPNRPVILMEHGVGLTFGKPAYADGYGQRDKIAIFLVPNQHTQNVCHPGLRDRPHPIVGMPKMDPWARWRGVMRPIPRKPTIAIAFHHGDKNSRPAEVGSAWENYISFLPELASRYKLLIHAHPMAIPALMERYSDLVNNRIVEYVQDFKQVLDRADIYLNDCSSTLYEFAVTGKPVVILNAPWFDKKAKYGIRFWEYTDIGVQVESPESLPEAIERTISNPDEFRPRRERMVRELFPHLGSSAEKAVSEIDAFIQAQPRKRRNVPDTSPVIAHKKRIDDGMRRFYIARNTDSDEMFYNALIAAGYVEADHPSLADFILHDAVHPGLERYIDSMPVFITPHTPQSSFLWDGILDPSPVCCNFTYGEAGRMTMKAYGYPYRTEAVGFGRCKVREYKPTKGNDLLIVPAHPSRRGQYPNSEYLAWVWVMLRRVLKYRGRFGKVTLCWSEERIDTAILDEMRAKGIDRVVVNPWTEPQPLVQMMKKIEAADLVMSCNTTGCVAVAMGKPTVFFSERGDLRSTPKNALHPESYIHFLKFPLQADDMSIDDILAVCKNKDPRVEKWKQENIGGNFNADKFIEVVKEYIP